MTALTDCIPSFSGLLLFALSTAFIRSPLSLRFFCLGVLLTEVLPLRLVFSRRSKPRTQGLEAQKTGLPIRLGRSCAASPLERDLLHYVISALTEYRLGPEQLLHIKEQ